MHLAICCESTRTHIHTHQSDCMNAFYILRLMHECFLDFDHAPVYISNKVFSMDSQMGHMVGFLGSIAILDT